MGGGGAGRVGSDVRKGKEAWSLWAYRWAYRCPAHMARPSLGVACKYCSTGLWLPVSPCSQMQVEWGMQVS